MLSVDMTYSNLRIAPDSAYVTTTKKFTFAMPQKAKNPSKNIVVTILSA